MRACHEREKPAENGLFESRFFRRTLFERVKGGFMGEDENKDQPINLNNKEELQAIISEVLPSVLKFEKNSETAEGILKGMLEEELELDITRDGVKTFLIKNFEERATRHQEMTKAIGKRTSKGK